MVSLGDLKYLRRISEGYFRTISAAPHKPDPRHWRDDQLTVSWLGHATVLLNFFGVWILTDPALRARVGVRVGPLTSGPKRHVAPALRTSELDQRWVTVNRAQPVIHHCVALAQSLNGRAEMAV